MMKVIFLNRLRNLLTGKTRKFHRLIKFVLIGIVNTFLYYIIFVVFFMMTGRHNVAVVIATVIGILFNFLSTGRFVFGNRSWRALFPFVLAYTVGLAFNITLLNFLINFGINTLLAQALSLPAIIVV